MEEVRKLDEDYLDEDTLDSLKIPQLKQYLRKHGQNVSGRRSELLQRAKGVAVIGLRDVQLQNNEDERLHAKRTADKLLTPLGEKIPNPTSLVTGWSCDVTNIPDFTDGCIYNYLVLKMKAKRQLKSKVFCQDRHVHRVEYHPISEKFSHCLVRCQVIPSLPSSNKKENPDYSVWVSLSKVTGNVNSADCNCTAGLGEACNHIGALLYAMVEISGQKKDGTLASTSQKCVWNNPRKRRLSPKKAEVIFDKRGPSTDGIHFKSTVNVTRFRERLLANNSSAGWLTFYPRPSNSSCAAISRTDDLKNTCSLNPFNVEFMFRDGFDLDSYVARGAFSSYFDRMSVTEEDCLNIEKETRGQSNNAKWLSLRKGRITSSNFGQVFHRMDSTPPDNLVKVLMGYNTFDNKFVKWGRDHEPAARRMYCYKMKESHPDFKVDLCGLLINTKYPHLGSSPDGLVHDICCGKVGMLEIKCPAAERWKTQSPLVCAKDKDFFCQVDGDDNIVLKHNHAYYYQVQGQLAISGKKWCDFVVWTLVQPMSIERIYFDAELWNRLLEKLNKFYVKAIIPEMYSARVSRGLPLYA